MSARGEVLPHLVLLRLTNREKLDLEWGSAIFHTQLPKLHLSRSPPLPWTSPLTITALIPALPQHEKAAPYLEAAAQGDIDLFVSTHALAECYASLTALPLSPQITPGQAHRLIRENVAAGGISLNLMQTTTSASSSGCPISDSEALGLRSGAVYDALHVRCAESVSAQELRTFNGRDVRRMPPADPTELVVL